ncbi:uncharacterized protein LOC132798417 [Drosophila nasuta]|uniref:uncharacterized protein LOC132798417 n=1 Tax=Drosophila nasuta TaxID=42062 RepID=UPI00295F0E0B|nr:uncharacterized protein LOC132798417 [Drosophila nasuta]
MAFVARRSIEGKLVDCQVISGLRGKSSMSVSDVSDDDTDSGTVHGYSSRSYVSPTVRYVAKDEEDNISNSYTQGRGMQRDLDSVSRYADEYESGEEESGNELQQIDDQGAGGDYLYRDEAAKSIILEKDVDEKTVLMPHRKVAGGGDADRELHDSLSLASIDEDTVCSPMLHGDSDADCLSIVSNDVSTVCHSDAKTDDVSMVSFDVATVCQPSAADKLQPDDTISLDSMNCASVYRAVKPSEDAVSTNTFDCQSQLTSRTYNVKSTTVRRDDCSSASTCSWTDMYGGALKQSESRSNIVPSLSLNLSTASSSGSSTYFRTFDDKKQQHGQAAYQDWVKRKERQKQQKKQAAKMEREKRDAENAMRQRLAKERYQEWCRQKELQQKKPATSSLKSAGSSTGYSSQSSTASSGGLSPNRTKLQRKETKEAIQKRLADWERVKKQQQLRERERQQQQQHSKEQLELQRKQRNEGAWQNWMKSVNKRAKPVPLNQGFDTLRGTISNIYVNPNQWVSNIDPNDSRAN